MAIPLTVDGSTFSYPEQGDVGYAGEATDWASAVTTAVADAEADIVTLQAAQTLYAARAAVIATSSVATSCTGSATTQIPFATESVDTASAWSGTVFTAPTTGRYLVAGQVALTVPASTALSLTAYIRVNGSTTYAFGIGAYTSSVGEILCPIPFSMTCQLTAGNTLDIAVVNGVGTARSLGGSTSYNYISIQQQA